MAQLFQAPGIDEITKKGGRRVFDLEFAETWNLELETWNLELEIWNLELETWNLELER